MFSVRMSELSSEQLQSFISSYRGVFLQTYSDTGIFNEDLIKQSYIELSLNLDKQIRYQSKVILEKPVVF